MNHIRFILVLNVFLLFASDRSFAQAQAGDRVIKLFEELTNANAPTGFEGPVREILKREFSKIGLEVSTDGLGSVIAVMRSSAAQPRIMVDAHMDEVGLMVRYITEDGFVKFQTLGGWLDQALINQRWVIDTRKGPVLAFSGIRAIHITPSEIRGRVTPATEIFLDVGVGSKKEAEALGVRPGDPISPWSPFTPIANNRYAAKAWDARIGCVLMIEAARRMKEQGIKLPNTVYFVGSVQEEVGMRGAQTAAKVIKPDLGISLEVGIATDHPGVGPDLAQERLGKGPGIFLYDSSMLVNLKLKDFFIKTSEKEGIPLQTEVIAGYGEDASAMQMHATGTPAINFTVPTRYVHSHTGIIDRADFDNALNLLMKVLASLDSKTVAEIASF
jgi:putative aminopeptidase FrvX